MERSLLEDIKRLKAMADTGLLYAENEFDRERYTEMQEICFRMLHTVSGQPVAQLKNIFPVINEYPTAKVDIRCLVLSADNHVLLVKESADGKWSLPGGWADVGYSPEETAVKECKEETGLDVNVKKLLAVFDKRKHPHPAHPFYVYKLAFYCQVIGGEINKGFDVMDVGYFPLDELPEISEERILPSQIKMLAQKISAADFETFFD